MGGRGLQGGKETVNLTNLELENYVKESRERLLTAARYVDIDLIEPAQETKIEAEKQKKVLENVLLKDKSFERT